MSQRLVERARRTRDDNGPPTTRWAALAGLFLGVAFAAVVWATVAVKLIAAVLPLAEVGRRLGRPWRRTARVLGWTEAAVLTGYGVVLTGVGLLVQGGAIDVAASADHRALRWHAFLWDPWFLLWGLAVLVVMITSRRPARPGPDETRSGES